ncbi:MAG: VOC family protein [Cellulomonadaceae bacterium]|jgi:catechol 2,3-dioxygenase-like lactoylglutathione lyase family enzyme|nr:VOC family protein [Cellulomonadaceae bacterium]
MMLNHMSIQCADLGASATFYDAVLAAVSGRRLIDFSPEAIGYGTTGPEFWIGGQQTGEGFRETHIAFTAPTRGAVDAFFAAATAQGAEVLYEPKEWPEYTDGEFVTVYYAAFVRDPDGNNVEACWMA